VRSPRRPCRPRSPCAVAKAGAFWAATNYRDAYGMHASSGILFNHESPLRRERFVTQKIGRAACRVAAGSTEKLCLGNVDVRRNRGWAPEYVEAMWLMLQKETPDDFVITTGVSHRLIDFDKVAFAAKGLKWQQHVETSGSLKRPTEVTNSHGNPDKAWQHLGWKATSSMAEVARKMAAAANVSSHGGNS
jgi:GDPmannose 4,6-dehydratase